MDDPLSFGRLVRQYRRLRDLTQEALAQRIACALTTIKKIEGGERRPSRQLAERLAQALEIPQADIPAFLRLARGLNPDAVPRALPLAPQLTPQELGAEDLRGHEIRGYALRERLGIGGFGAVYRAIQSSIQREVAVKIILPRFANQPDFVRRFAAEAQFVARLEHPHIVPLYDFWREPDSAYLVMRYLWGGSLATALRGGPLAPLTVLRVLEQIGEALAVAHRVNVVHRDLKPSNVLRDIDGNAYLADFGIAKDLLAAGEEGATQAGAIVGSPDYLSPEQITAEPVTPRTDIYSLGVMLYELLTAVKPFRAQTSAELLRLHLTTPLPSLQAHVPELPIALDAVIQCATAKHPDERFADVKGLVDAFRDALPMPRPLGSEQAVHEQVQEARQAPHTIVLNPPAIENPYKGLRAFGEADAATFFGRNALVTRLLERLAEQADGARFLAVVGPSGSGKSSVVRAGLIPALRQGGLPGSEQWFITDLIPGSHPVEELELALLKIAVRQPPGLAEQLRRDERGLLRATRLALPEDESDLVLVIDQFEEIFTLVADEQARRHFLDSIIAAVIDPRSRLRVVITLRADFYDRPLVHPQLGALMRERTELVLPLTADELEQAIVAPARHAGVLVEPELVTDIVRDVASQPGALPLLQHVLTELFEQREGNVLSRAMYRASGGVRGALGRHAEHLYQGLDHPSQQAARQLFLRLMTLGEGGEDTRRRMLLDELAPPVSNSMLADLTTSSEANESTGSLLSNHLDISTPLLHVCATFGAARLLTFDRDAMTRHPTVEVAHEALLREWLRLRSWLEQSRAAVRVQRQLAAAAAEWVQHGHDAGFLAAGARLAQFETLADDADIGLNAVEQAYLDASRVQRRQHERVEQERQERELAQARALAEEQRARAQEQAAMGQQLQRRAWLLTSALVLTVVITLVAVGLAAGNASLAKENAQVAATAQSAEGVAVAAQAIAQAERDRAEQSARVANSRAFAALALNSLLGDPERSILLSLHALEQATTAEAEDALHQAVLASRVRRTFAGHSDEVYSVSFSPDGALLASGGEDQTAKIWDVRSGQELRTISGHNSALTRVTFTADGAQLVTGDVDGVVKVWDVATGRALHSLGGHTVWIADLAISPDGTWLATASADDGVKIWDTRSWRERRGTSFEAPIMSLAASPDSARLAAGLENGTVILWDVETSAELLTLPAHDHEIVGVAFSPDGKLIGIAGFDGIARVFDVATQDALYSLAGHTSSLSRITFTPDGSYVITSSQDGTAKVWEAATGREQFAISGHTGAGAIYDSAVMPGCVEPPAAPFAWCGTTLATASRDHTVKLWDISPTGSQELLVVPGFIPQFSAEGLQLTTVLYSDDNTGLIQRWPLDPQPDASSSSQLIAERLTQGQTSQAFVPSTAGSLLGLALSPDGRLLAKGTTDGTVIVWDTADGSELHRLGGLTDRIESLSFSPDGRQLAAASLEGTAKVWDVRSGAEQLTLSSHSDEVVGVAFSGDGKYIATGSQDTTAKIWDAVTGRELATLSGHTNGVVPVAFSPDSRLLATGSRDGTAKLWDIATRSELLTLRGHTAALRSIAFSPDGQHLVTGSGDATARVWDISNGPLRGQSLLTLHGHRASVRSIAFSPDGARIATGSRDGTVRVYALDRDELVALARARLTRTWTQQECLQYLRSTACPSNLWEVSPSRVESHR
jgi:WD40 repeat protein/DNA-binding XRE family transcriptional regulator